MTTLDRPSIIREYWTNSRGAVVIDGMPEIIRDIALHINVPVDETILVTPGRALLGIWGGALSRYLGDEEVSLPARGAAGAADRWPR
jgi:hypothetical protein